MATPATPRHRAHAAEPSTPHLAGRLNTGGVHGSPAYSTTRRHSLYGTEDRIILDPGSRVWKAGFSGEGRPRDVFFVGGSEQSTLWTLSRAKGGPDGEEKERMLRIVLQKRLREVFHQCLLTDPKSRKVIVVEHPLLPLYIKEIIAQILFENLQIPSLSFASSHLLALLAVGRMTGLVLDCGYLQSTALPIFSSRPLFPQLRTTPLAGSRFTSHLRALLLLFGTYIPPPSTLSGAANIPTASRSMRVPEEVLTDAVMEQIKTQCCFVGAAFEDEEREDAYDREGGAATPQAGDDSMDLDVPPSETSESRLESEASRSAVDQPVSPPSSQLSGPSSFSAFTGTQARGSTSSRHGATGEGHLQAIAEMYSRQSTATDLKLRVDPPVSQQTGTGKGVLLIPGWIRERAAEVLFEGGDVDESSVAEVILESLLKVPVDLRKTLSSSILVIGGTPMLPGFIPRLHAEIIRLLTHRPPSRQQTARTGRPRPPSYDPYASLRQLAPCIAILNNPSPSPSSPDSPAANAGKAPAFTPACLSWVGGSLAGALKIGGVEVAREKWDEATLVDEDEDDEEGMQSEDGPTKRSKFCLPDWTRTTLPSGAPPAPRPPKIEIMAPQAAVGA